MAEPKPDHEFPTEADVDTVLAEFGGDARVTIKALLSDLAKLAGDFEVSVSRGFVRGDVPTVYLRRQA